MISLIVGLGNPGKEHKGNRHNVGADLITAIAGKHHVRLESDKKFFGLRGKVTINKRELHLLVPDTYMNRSGRSVSAFCNFFKIIPENILVCHDELDFPPGTIRLKKGGGHGGHNGLRDIIKCLGGNDFLRLRIGIGHPGDARRVSDYVLKNPSRDDRELIDSAIDRAIEQLPDIAGGNIEKAMNALHSSHP